MFIKYKETMLIKGSSTKTIKSIWLEKGIKKEITGRAKFNCDLQIQSNFNFFCQHPHFEVLFIIGSKYGHVSSRIAHNSPRPKSC